MSNPSIESLAGDVVPEIYLTPAFRAVLEDHLTWLQNHPSTRTQSVSKHQGDVYDFDWVGLLRSLKIQPALHWITIRMNGGLSLVDVPPTMDHILVPDVGVVQNLIQVSASNTRIT